MWQWIPDCWSGNRKSTTVAGYIVGHVCLVLWICGIPQRRIRTLLTTRGLPAHVGAVVSQHGDTVIISASRCAQGDHITCVIVIRALKVCSRWSHYLCNRHQSTEGVLKVITFITCVIVIRALKVCSRWSHYLCNRHQSTEGVLKMITLPV